MFGRVYRIEGDDSGSDGSRIAAYASFGGLLMRLKGEAVEIARMTRIANAFKNGEITEEVLEVCPDLASLYKQSEKLKYRKAILERVKWLFLLFL
ncbi:unnamed protein product [Cylicostephanus goldi]|uniref:Uncharacterized protein n=1 Tax=Cylicostephanus goldi TaxID=71465 RepID=A0A3P7P6Y4_CYLGO|nr:unnamed protein product [Cylicostephanus goldi]